MIALEIWKLSRLPLRSEVASLSSEPHPTSSRPGSSTGRFITLLELLRIPAVLSSMSFRYEITAEFEVELLHLVEYFRVSITSLDISEIDEIRRGESKAFHPGLKAHRVYK